LRTFSSRRSMASSSTLWADLAMAGADIGLFGIFRG
jgi:hypothetical protein